MSAANLLAEAACAGVSLRLVGSTVKVRGTPSPALLAKLRAAKADLARHLTEFSDRPEARTRPLTWLDLDDWCSLLGEQRGIEARRAVLFDWIDATGGRSDTMSVYLATSLPRNLALSTMKMHARALGLAVRTLTEAPETG